MHIPNTPLQQRSKIIFTDYYRAPTKVVNMYAPPGSKIWLRHCNNDEIDVDFCNLGVIKK